MWPKDTTWLEDVCASPTALVMLAAIPTERFRAWQLTPTGNALCPRAMDYHIMSGLTQNTFASTNFFSSAILCPCVIFSLVGMISLWLSGAKGAIYGRADPTRFKRWSTIMKPATMAVMIVTTVGMYYCFVSMARIILASASHANLVRGIWKIGSLAIILFGVVAIVNGVALAYARGLPFRCDCEEFDVADEAVAQGGGKRSVAVTEAKL